MNNILVVVDMQKDFVDGVLGTPEAQAIVPQVKEYVQNAAASGDKIIFTRDTHNENYLGTREGKYLPVPHCIEGSAGWQIIPELQRFAADAVVVDKPAFGSVSLMQMLMQENTISPIQTVTLMGLCTDICVISNAMMIKSAIPEVNVKIVSSCCAGVTPESHENALKAMQMCQIDIL